MTAITADNLPALNSMTKYPSIPTYHALGDRGVLLEERVAFAGEVLLTEKVDGTNGRIILLPGGRYLIGSRAEILYASGDLAANPALGIVEALRPVADRLAQMVLPEGTAVVHYGEVYGGKITPASKSYARGGQVGFRVFDVAVIHDYQDLLKLPVDQVAAWRDNRGPRWLNEGKLRIEVALAGVKLTPRLGRLSADDLPVTVDEMGAYLASECAATRVALDGVEPGRAEGVVLRAPDRSVIAKARIQDYSRTDKVRADAR